MRRSYKILALLAFSMIILASCSGSRYSTGASHNHGVSTRGFSGY